MKRTEYVKNPKWTKWEAEVLLEILADLVPPPAIRGPYNRAVAKLAEVIRIANKVVMR